MCLVFYLLARRLLPQAIQVSAVVPLDMVAVVVMAFSSLSRILGTPFIPSLLSFFFFFSLSLSFLKWRLAHAH